MEESRALFRLQRNCPKAAPRSSPPVPLAQPPTPALAPLEILDSGPASPTLRHGFRGGCRGEGAGAPGHLLFYDSAVTGTCDAAGVLSADETDDKGSACGGTTMAGTTVAGTTSDETTSDGTEPGRTQPTGTQPGNGFASERPNAPIHGLRPRVEGPKHTTLTTRHWCASVNGTRACVMTCRRKLDLLCRFLSH